MTISETLSFSLLAFTSVFFIVNPFGAVPVFLALTDGWTIHDRKKAALQSALVAGGVLLAFLFAGNLIFRFFGVTLGAFRLAGGILLLRVGMDMLHGKPSATRSTPEDHQDLAARGEVSITPMGVPQLAGPGAIATVMLLPGGATREIWRFLPIVLSVLATVSIAYFVLQGAEKVQRILGPVGTRILTKIMGLLIATMAMQFVAYGVRDLLPTILEKVAGKV